MSDLLIEQVNPYLNLLDSRFRVLITTRLKLNEVKELELGVLTESASVELLRVLGRDPQRIDNQLADAQQLCEWLGYLPLGLELVGRYLARREDLSLVEMLERLEAKKLAAQALVQAKQITAQLGVAAAFQLTWEDEQFPNEAKMLCGLLSVFALAPIPWNLVEKCLPDWDKEALEDCRVEYLLGRSLLSRVGKELFQLHQLLREFFAAKREQNEFVDALKQSFCQAMVAIAHQISSESTLEEIQFTSSAIPHLQIAAEEFASSLNNEDLIWPFTGVAHFYNSQGLYKSAEIWYESSLSATQVRFGENDINVANSLNNLAEVNRKQGNYSKAEEFHLRALQIRVNVLGEFHSAVAISLNNLAEIYHIQGHYSKAE